MSQPESILRADAAVIEAARQGDRQAMERLLSANYDRIYAVCRRITGNEADAADAAQEALMSIVRSIGKFDGRSSFSTWVYRIATNASLDELRRRRRRPLLQGDHDHDRHHRHDGNRNQGDEGVLGMALDNDRIRANDATAIDRVADQMVLDAAMRTLPDEFRVPLVLRDVGDLDYAEIAATLDIPLGTVKSRIARGRSALAHVLRAGNQPTPDERPTPDDERPDDERPDDERPDDEPPLLTNDPTP